MALEPVLIAGEWRQPANPTGSFKAIDPSDGQAAARIVSRVVDRRRDRGVPRRRRRGGRAAVDPGRRDRAVPRRLRGAHRGRRRRAGRPRRPRDRPRARAAPAQRRAAAHDQPASPGRGRRARSVLDARRRSTPRRTCARSTGRWAAPVVVFGPNNFPFAFNSVAGGDFVAAIAAGNPVIGKANTGHPGTSKLLAELAIEAARAAGLPPGMVQLLYRTPPDVGFVAGVRSARRARPASRAARTPASS